MRGTPTSRPFEHGQPPERDDPRRRQALILLVGIAVLMLTRVDIDATIEASRDATFGEPPLPAEAAYRPGIYLQPMGDTEQQAQEAGRFLRRHLTTPVYVLPGLPRLGDEHLARGQTGAISVLEELEEWYPSDEGDPRTIIALTDADIYPEDLDWNWAFSRRTTGELAVVSTARMYEHNGPEADRLWTARSRSRLEKQVMRTALIQHYGARVPADGFEGTILGDPPLSVAELDHTAIGRPCDWARAMQSWKAREIRCRRTPLPRVDIVMKRTSEGGSPTEDQEPSGPKPYPDEAVAVVFTPSGSSLRTDVVARHLPVRIIDAFGNAQFGDPDAPIHGGEALREITNTFPEGQAMLVLYVIDQRLYGGSDGIMRMFHASNHPGTVVISLPDYDDAALRQRHFDVLAARAIGIVWYGLTPTLQSPAPHAMGRLDKMEDDIDRLEPTLCPLLGEIRPAQRGHLACP